MKNDKFYFNLPSEEIIDRIDYAMDPGKYVPMIMPFEDEEAVEGRFPPGGFFKIISEQ